MISISLLSDQSHNMLQNIQHNMKRPKHDGFYQSMIESTLA